MSEIESNNKSDIKTISKKIPKIIHQIWIGPKPRPHILMDSWRLKNPDFEYILWNEAEI